MMSSVAVVACCTELLAAVAAGLAIAVVQYSRIHAVIQTNCGAVWARAKLTAYTFSQLHRQ